MAGVREKKKEALRQQILQAAKDCFLTDGFAETTIVDIAKRANIGVGTLYNYFPSKALLFIESYYRDMGNPKDKLEEILRKYSDNPALTVVHIIEVYMEPYCTLEKNTLRELLHVFMDSLAKHQELGEFVTASKFTFVDFIARILEAYQQKGILDPDIHPKDGAFCIYSIISTQTLFFIIDDNITFQTMQDNILRQSKLFFKGKLRQRGAGI
jgi:AcrR family transcriptional regulator